MDRLRYPILAHPLDRPKHKESLDAVNFGLPGPAAHFLGHQPTKISKCHFLQPICKTIAEVTPSPLLPHVAAVTTDVHGRPSMCAIWLQKRGEMNRIHEQQLCNQNMMCLSKKLNSHCQSSLTSEQFTNID